MSQGITSELLDVNPLTLGRIFPNVRTYTTFHDVIFIKRDAICRNLDAVCTNPDVLLTLFKAHDFLVPKLSIIFAPSFKIYRQKFIVMLKYYVQEIRDLRDPDSGKMREIYKVLFDRSVSGEHFMNYVARHSILSDGQVQMVCTTIADFLGELLANNGCVTLPGIGSFSIAIRPKEDKRKGLQEMDGEAEGPGINARSIEMDHINFRCSKELLSDVKGRLHREGTFQRDPYGGHVPIYKPSIENRLKRFKAAREYLSTNPIMRIADYAELTGLSYSSAQRELRLAATMYHSGILAKGRGSHRVYVLNKNYVPDAFNQ